MFESVEQLEKEVKEFQQNILASSEFIKKLDEVVASISSQERDFAAKSAALTAKIDNNTDALRASQAEAIKKLLDENHALIKHLSDTATELESQMKSQVETVMSDHQVLVEQLIERNSAISTEFGDKSASIIAEIKAIPVELQKRNEALADSFQKGVSSVIETANSISASQKALVDALSAHCDDLLSSMNEAEKEHLEKTTEDICATQKAYITKIEEAETELKECKADLFRKYDDFLNKLESTNIDQMFKLCQEMKHSINTKLIVIMSGVGAALILALISLIIK